MKFYEFCGPLTIIVALATAADAAPQTRTWLACEGQKVITRGQGSESQTETQPAHNVFFIEEDIGNFYQYFENTKQAGRQPVTFFSENMIAWDAPSYGRWTTQPSWSGQLDRKTMQLTMTHKEPGETIVWTQTCKPIPPR